jgi:hypothetical protein
VWHFVIGVVLQVFAECSGTKVQVIMVLARVWAVTASIDILFHEMCHPQFLSRVRNKHNSFKLYGAFKIGLQHSTVIQLAKDYLVLCVKVSF